MKLFLVLLLVFGAATAYGEIYTWKDAKGTEFYTNSLTEIPARYLKKARVLDVATGKKGALATAQPGAAAPNQSSAQPTPAANPAPPPTAPASPVVAAPLPPAAPATTITERMQQRQNRAQRREQRRQAAGE